MCIKSDSGDINDLLGRIKKLEDSLNIQKDINEQMKEELSARIKLTDDVFELCQKSNKLSDKLFKVIFVLVPLSIIGSSWQVYNTNTYIDRFKADMNREVKNKYEILPYEARVGAGRYRLMYGNDGEKDSAIWFDLLGPLNQAAQEHRLIEVAEIYKTILLPLKPILNAPKPRESMVGALWIIKYLLETNKDDIREELNKNFILKSFVNNIQNKDISDFSDEKKKEFNDALSKIENLLVHYK
ncbi:MAG: hypothetical protein H7843_09370 [Nitrospirota bacterium]